MKEKNQINNLTEEIEFLEKKKRNLFTEIKSKQLVEDTNIDSMIIDLREAKVNGNHSEAVRIIRNLNDALNTKIHLDTRSLPEQITDYARSSSPIKYPWDIDLYMKNGGFHVFGARPGVGKTTLACNFCYQAFLSKQPSVFFSFEQIEADIWIKLIQFYLSDKLNENVKFYELMSCFRDSHSLPGLYKKVSDALIDMKPHIKVIDASGWTIRDISSAYEECKNDFGARRIRYAVIDYIQRVRPSKESGNSKLEKIESVIMDLTAKVKRTNSAWIVLSQLTRRPNQEKNAHPDSSWFKETGTIEEDATQAIILQRESDETGRYKDVVDMHVVKNRYGRTGMYDLLMEESSGLITRQAHR